MIKIDFEFETNHGTYRDALHLDENHGLTDSEIQAIKQQRVDNWIAMIEAPTPELTPEEIVALEAQQNQG
jgi:hypothetical protein